MSDPTRPRAYAQPRRRHPDAVTVLVLGIVGVAIPIVAFPAWFVGNRALADVRRHPGQYENEDLVRTGRMLGKVMSILSLLGLAGFLIIVGFFVMPGADR